MKKIQNVLTVFIATILILTDILTPINYSVWDEIFFSNQNTEFWTTESSDKDNSQEIANDSELTPSESLDNNENSLIESDDFSIKENAVEENIVSESQEEITENSEENTEEPSQEQENNEEPLENTEGKTPSESSEESHEDQATSQEQEEMNQENLEEKNKAENQETTHEETENPENAENSESKEESESTTAEEVTEISGDNSKNSSASVSENTEPEITEEKENSGNWTVIISETNDLNTSTWEGNIQEDSSALPQNDENGEDDQTSSLLNEDNLEDNSEDEENQDVESTEEQTEETNEEHPEEQIEEQQEQSEEPTIRSTLNQEPIIGSKKFRQVRVDVRANENTFPSGTYLKITPVYTEDLAQIQEEFTDTEIVAFDIQFLFDLEDETIELQPYTWKTVQVSFDYTQKEEFKNLNANEELQVYHIKDEETVMEGEKIAEIAPLNTEETEQKADTLVIDAEHFSIYAIIKTSVPNDVLVHYDSGLWSFSDHSNQIDVTYHYNNWIYLADKNSSIPNFTGNMFRGRYTSSECTTRWNGVTEDTNEDEITVYACYLPFEDKEINLNGITFRMMDRNLGALSPNDKGFWYQWGNNYGFEEGENGFTPAISTEMISATPSEWDDRSREIPYYSSNFVSREKKPYRWDSHGSMDLWGEDLRDDLQKQGPCPNGYHIPNKEEWNALYTSYITVNKSIKNFSTTIGIPFWWYRNRVAATITSVGDVGWYWSSTSKDWSDAYAFTFTDDNGNPQEFKSRVYANNIRCFKNNNQNLTLTFETNGGTAVEPQTFKRYEARTESFNPTSTKDGRIVVWWYKDIDLQNLFKRSDSTFLGNDTTLYAKWWCNPWYVLNANDECVLRKVQVTYKNGSTTHKTVTYSRNTSGQYIWNIVNVPIPTKNNYMFDNWYLDTGFTKVWYFPYDTDGLWENITVYAHFLPFEEKRIQFWDVDFIIMDRNLWAKSTSNWWTDANDNNIWYFYQFWNNYWFVNTWTLPNTNANLMPNYSKPYSNGMFVLWNGQYTVWNVDSEWWGNIHWGISMNPDSNKIWPCPNGYHIPETTEINYYYNKFNTWKDTNEWKTYCGTLGVWACWAKLLWLPFWWQRVQTTSNLSERWSVWYYRYSNTIETQLTTRFTASYAQKIINNGRSNPQSNKTSAFNLRCFKDTPSYRVTWDTMWWYMTRTYRFRDWQPYSNWTTSKMGSIFDGYYLDKQYTIARTWHHDYSTFDADVVTLYAKWKCKEGFVMNALWNCESTNTVDITFYANTGTNTAAHFPDGTLSKTIHYLATSWGYYTTNDAEIQVPELSWKMFEWWYTNQSLTSRRQWLGESTNYQTLTLYPKYLPFNDRTLVFDDLSFTIMDRNLWATMTGITCDNQDWWACGHWYQRWNNFPFFKSTNYSNQQVIKTSPKNRWPWNYYFNGAYMKINGIRTQVNYPNMRWWNWETASKHNKDTDKQGPCPKWYHIPWIYEWNAAYTNWLSWSKTPEWVSFCTSKAWNDVAKCFFTSLFLSYAWYYQYEYRNPFNSKSRYWSATPNGTVAYALAAEYSVVTTPSNLARNHGATLRCFKDSPDLTITYDTNWGSAINPIKNFKWWNAQTKTTIIPQRAHSQFVGWFTDEALTQEVSRNGSKYFSKSFTLYAKWECDDGYQISMDRKSCVAATVVNFDAIANEGEVNRPIASYDSGDLVDLSEFVVSKEWWEFVWWSTSQNGREPIENFTIGYDDIRLYAIFRKDITATFQKNGNKNLTLNGETNETFSQTCTLWNDETSCTIQSPEIITEPWFHILWFSTGANNHHGAYLQNTEIAITDNITLYAQSEKDAIERNITFYPNGSEGFIFGDDTKNIPATYLACTIPAVYNSESQEDRCTTSITFPKILVNGEKTIFWWAKNASDLEDIIVPETSKDLTFSSDLSFYAQTQSDGKNFTVTFYGNGAKVNGKESIQEECSIDAVLNGWIQQTSCEVSLPTITRDWFIILWWNTEGTATTIQYPKTQTTLTVSWDLSLYVISSKEITSIFKKNGNDAQIKGGERILNDITESCTIRNSSSSCMIQTPTIVSTNTPHILGYSTWENIHISVANQNSSFAVSKPWIYYAQSQKDADPLTITFYLNQNDSFTYQGTTYSSKKETFDLCTKTTVYNGEIQSPCVVSLTFPIIEAPSATPQVLWRSTDNSIHEVSYQAWENVTLSSDSDLSFFAQTYKPERSLRAIFTKSTGISNIQPTDQTCSISATYNGINQKTSCDVNAPDFTVTTGYHTPLWKDTTNSEFFWDATNKEKFTLSKDSSYQISATPRNDIAYIVEHYQENANDTGYTLKERENLTGTTDTMTNAQLKNYPWFSWNALVQANISAEETTVVKLYYQRKMVPLHFNTNGGTSLPSRTFKYGSTVQDLHLDPTKTWYTFAWWTPSFPQIMPLNGATLTAQWTPNTNTKYTVQHHKEKIGGGYDIETENKTWTTDTQTHATAKTYSGFTLSGTFSQSNIQPDGSTVVNIYYKRNFYTITFDSNSETSVSDITVKYEIPLTKPTDPTKTWYTFAWWTPTFPSIMPLDGANLKAQRTPNTNTKYTVQHHKEKIGGGYDVETENKTWTTDTQTHAEAKNYSWFTLSGTVSQSNIQSDGSTVINIYYKRNEYTVSFDSDGGTAISAIKAKYEAPLTKPSDPTKTWYTFAWWNPSFPSIMPLSGTTLTAQWMPNPDTKYIVKHHKEKIGGWYDVEPEKRTWTTDTQTHATAKTY